MGSYIARRVLALVPVALVVGTAVFLLMHLIPGDPTLVMLGAEARAEDADQLRRAMGLDQPLAVQYVRWFGRLLRGDLGLSIFLRRPVTEVVVDRIEPTLVLTCLSTVVAAVFGITLGTVAAARANTWVDQLLMGVAVFGVSVPYFWLALNLILLFSVLLAWFPAAGYASLAEGGLRSLKYLLLPTAALGFTQSAFIARITRSTVLQTLREDYIRTAWAKGVGEGGVLRRHALRNALIPIVTVLGLGFSTLLGGAIITETIFNIPGLGRLTLQAILRRDYPVIQGVVLFIAGIYVVVNLIVDIMYVYIDPRVKYQ